MFTNLPEAAENPDLAVAADLLSSVIAERYFEDVMGWLEARQAEPAEWQRAAQFGDTFLYITADELAALGEQTQQMVTSTSTGRPIPRSGHPAPGWSATCTSPSRCCGRSARPGEGAGQ